MAASTFDSKKYLDLVGLGKYDAKIKEFLTAAITTEDTAIKALIGSIPAGATETDVIAYLKAYADAQVKALNDGQVKTNKEAIEAINNSTTGILATAKNYVDGKIGTLDASYQTVAAAIAGEALARATADGDLTTLTTDAKTSLVDAIKEVDAHADSAQNDLDALEAVVYSNSSKTGLQDKVAALEEAVGEGGSVAAQIKTEIEKLDATVTNVATGENAVQPDVQISIVEEDGKLKSVSTTVTPNRFDAYGAAKAVQGETTTTVKGLEDKVGTVPAKVGETDTATVVSYVDAKALAAQTAAEGKVTALDNSLATVAKSGKASDVTVEDTANHFVGTEVESVLAEIAVKIETLNADENTIGSVKKIVGDAVAALVDGAPEALDTLSEIASWISNQDQNVVTDVTSLVTRVDANTSAIGVKSSEGVNATGIYARLETLETKTAGSDVATQIKTAIEALDVDEVGGTAKYIKSIKEVDGKIVAMTGDTTEFDEAGAASAVQGSTTATVKDVEDSLGNFTGSWASISETEINALFATE